MESLLLHFRSPLRKGCATSQPALSVKSAAHGQAICVTVALLLLTTTGCVTRRLTVQSNPPGALLTIDDKEIGLTPVSTTYLRYGQRKFRLVKDGYETLTTIQEVPAPWYQIPPLDFVSENVVPGELRDQRTLNFNLTPQRNVETEELRGRAEELRAKTTSLASQAAGAASPGPVYPPPPDRMLPPATGPVGIPPNTQTSGLFAGATPAGVSMPGTGPASAPFSVPAPAPATDSVFQPR